MKSQDVVILAALLARPAQLETFEQLGRRSGMSASTAHASFKSLVFSRLLEPTSQQPFRGAVLDFLAHGLRYVFPARPGVRARGMATVHAVPPLKGLFNQREEPWVWPWEQGEDLGESLEPLYPTVPLVCAKDPVLREWLALFDAVRAGRAREQRFALEQLELRLGQARL
jgi:hypothetical protein